MKRQKKKAEKDKDKESTKAPSTPTAAMSSTAAPSTPATPVPCETGSVTSGGKSKGNEGDMDEVMRGVALLYSELAKSQRGRVAQSRSLASLRVEIFMSSDSSGHQLNNSLTGVGGVVLKIQTGRILKDENFYVLTVLSWIQVSQGLG